MFLCTLFTYSRTCIYYYTDCRHRSRGQEHRLAGHGQALPGPAAAGHISVPHGHQRVLLALVRRQPRAHLRAGPEEPSHRAAHHGAGHRVRSGVGRLGADIPVQRGAAHTPVHQPAHPGRAHDRVPVQPDQNATARRSFLGAARGGKTILLKIQQ